MPSSPILQACRERRLARVDRLAPKVQGAHELVTDRQRAPAPPKISRALRVALVASFLGGFASRESAN
jgi:hypothetical protein